MQVANEKSFTTEGKRPYICPKCSSSFDKFDEFNKHIQGFCTKVEPEKKAYCIAFKGSDCVSAQKRINFTVDDYYYGYVHGSSSYKKRAVNKKFSCYSCGKVLRNNLRFMSHVRHKIENEWKENDNVNDFNICSHCYRHYSSPFHLQCHIETVHATVPAATTCRICELNFENEQVFLMHMKDKHTYKEMPYICKLCSYRCSFYFDLTFHFRNAHENCNSLLCPFCLTIHQTANSYLTHVIQHMNKSVRCTQCRLQFFTPKDKAQHVETDHKSVFNCVGKKSLPKNPNQYMIFVKVSHHPLSPSKFNAVPQKKTGLVQQKEIMNKLPAGWTFTNQFDNDLPSEYRPYCRESKVFVVLSFAALRQNVTNCIECGENLGVFVANYNKHFLKDYRCRKCLYQTRCFQALKKHVFVYHLKQKYESPNATRHEIPATLSISPPSTDAPEGPHERDQKPDISASKSGCSTRFSARQYAKSAQPHNDSHSDSSDGLESSQTSPKTATLQATEDSKDTLALDPNQKSNAKKRRITDINSLLMMKEQENEKASKQRRKQLKPQRVDLSDDEGGEQTSSLLKKEKDASQQSVEPPPLDSSFTVDMDDDDDKPNVSDEEDVTSGNSSSPPKLKVKFASHLGLSKKKPPGSSSLKPFVKPRGGAHALPPMPSLLTPSLPSYKKKPPTSSTSLSRKPPASRKTARKSVPSRRQPSLPPTIKLPFPSKNTSGVIMQKTPCLSDLLSSPTNLSFSDVTNSSFLVSWKAPANTNLTEFKLVFQGAGLPTTQRLPAEQTSVRLIGLRSNTLYLVQLCSVYRVLQSSNIEGIQRTLGLREHKEKSKLKIDEVIVLDDDDDNDVTSTVITPVSGTVASSSGNRQIQLAKMVPFEKRVNRTTPKGNVSEISKKPATISEVTKPLPLQKAVFVSSRTSTKSNLKLSSAKSNLKLSSAKSNLKLSSQATEVEKPRQNQATSSAPPTVITPSESKKPFNVLSITGTNNPIIVVPDRSVKVTVVSAKSSHSEAKRSPVKEVSGLADAKLAKSLDAAAMSHPAPERSDDTPKCSDDSPKCSDDGSKRTSITILSDSELQDNCTSDEMSGDKVEPDEALQEEVSSCQLTSQSDVPAIRIDNDSDSEPQPDLPGIRIDDEDDSKPQPDIPGIGIDNKDDSETALTNEEEENEPTLDAEVASNHRSSSPNNDSTKAASENECEMEISNNDEDSSPDRRNPSHSIEVEVDVHRPPIVTKNCAVKDEDKIEVPSVDEQCVTNCPEPIVEKRKSDDTTTHGAEKAMKYDENCDVLEVIQEIALDNKKAISLSTSNGVQETENLKMKLNNENLPNDPEVLDSETERREKTSVSKPNINGITISVKPVSSVNAALSKQVKIDETTEDTACDSAESTKNCTNEIASDIESFQDLQSKISEEEKDRCNVNSSATLDKPESDETEKQTFSIQDLDDILSFLEDG